VIADWMDAYNQKMPESALGYLSKEEFRKQKKAA
jgi:transposase InsO family protein